jgi:hypothetical protein
MPRVGFELTIREFERAKTVHVLDRAATVIGRQFYRLILFNVSGFLTLREDHRIRVSENSDEENIWDLREGGE